MQNRPIKGGFLLLYICYTLLLLYITADQCQQRGTIYSNVL